MKNVVEIEGWANSEVYGTDKFRWFFLRFAKNSSIRVVVFNGEADTSEISRGCFMEIVGSLRVNRYNDNETIELIANEITVKAPVEDAHMRPKKQYAKSNKGYGSYQKQSYSKQPYQKQYSKPKYDI